MIIFEEIGMIPPDLLDFLDYESHIQCDCNCDKRRKKFFDGVQVVCVGDFAWLDWLVTS